MPSTVIFAMQYQPGRRELYIAFRTKREIYRYFDVGIEEWRNFLEADSKGAYLNQVFKLRDHPYETVSGPIPSAPRQGTSEPFDWGEAWALRKKAAGRVDPESESDAATA